MKRIVQTLRNKLVARTGAASATAAGNPARTRGMAAAMQSVAKPKQPTQAKPAVSQPRTPMRAAQTMAKGIAKSNPAMQALSSAYKRKRGK